MGITEHSDALFLTPLCLYMHVVWTQTKAFQEISNSPVSNVRHGGQRKGSGVFLRLLGLYLQYALLHGLLHFTGALRDQENAMNHFNGK